MALPLAQGTFRWKPSCEYSYDATANMTTTPKVLGTHRAMSHSSLYIHNGIYRPAINLPLHEVP